MKTSHILPLLCIATMVMAIVFVFLSGDDPSDVATEFFRLVQKGNTDRILRAFGDNSCHCAPPGGYIAYLKYESGQDPGIAFMLGRPSSVGAVKVEDMAADDEKYESAWDKPQNKLVTARIEFADPSTRPMLLPVDTAFGYQISQSQLSDYLAKVDDQWWRGFSLRLRNTLEPGLINANPPAPKSDKDKTETQILAEHGYLAAEALKYLHPKDPGAVMMPDGKPMGAPELAAKLPRLVSVGIQLKLVRRGAWGKWMVHKVGIVSPVVSVAGKDCQLVDPPAPKP